MKLSSCIVLRPISFLFCLMFVVLSLAGLLIPLWMYRVKKIESEVDIITYNISEELTSGVQKATAFFSPINISTINLVRYLSSSLDANEIRFFSLIQSKVAPSLFQALLTVPYLSQISYTGLDGLFFAYYTEGGHPFALYSNSTFSSSPSATKIYSWYMQPANQDTGKLYGEATTFRPSATLNTSWFQSALKGTDVYTSIETDWGNSQSPILLTTAGLNGKGAISFGITIKSLIDFFTSSISVYNGSLILCTKDGYLLTPGIPNTRVILVGNQVLFQLFDLGNDRVDVVGNVTCQSDNGLANNRVLSFWGMKYLISCSPVEIARLQLVYILVQPLNELSALIQNNKISASVLLILMVGFMVIASCTFVCLIVIAARREMHLCGALIKQMEATQQAERKSMNKTLAFASASHDIRAALAGITGLTEISRSIVPKRDPLGSELHKNLLQMEACSNDLQGILNSILDTTKIEAGKMHLEEEEFDMELILEDVVDLFHAVGVQKGVDVILDPCDGSIMKSSRVIGDRGKLKQILCNLLSNAVKFTSEGHVVVRAWTRKPNFKNEILASSGSNSISWLSCLFFLIDKAFRKSEVVKSTKWDPSCKEFIFEVNDTGRGIPKEQQKSVFENYVQVKETAFGKEGTGLGLGIVQSLVRLMGGEIGIVDKEVGEMGTCFRFNTFFSRCDATNISTSEREADGGVHGDYSLSNSFHSSGSIIRAHNPKSEVSQVILFIQSDKRSSILQNFMERMGIKVHIVNQHNQLSSTFKKIKQKLRLSQCNSLNSSDVNSSSTRSLKVPLSALDGMDSFMPSQGKHNARGGLASCILIVIDTSAGPFREISRSIAEFRRDLDNICCSRVVWLDKPCSDSSNFQGLDQHTLPQSDLIMSKPFHGSHLYQTLGLLPEFHGFPPPRKGEITHNVDDINSLKETATSGSGIVNVEKGMTRKYFTESVGNSKCEVEFKRSSQIKPLSKKKIMVADDDPVGLRIATSVASQLGANTFSCKNGKEALELVCRSLKDGTSNSLPPFDFIIMDCEMPVMNGIEATKRIRQEEKLYGFHIPIIALTAHGRGEEMDLMIEAGVDDFLAKPLNKDNLLKSISRLTC